MDHVDITGLTVVAITLLTLLVFVLPSLALVKVFSKAGKPGWAAIIPVYNIIVLLEIVDRPVWEAVLCLIPGVHIVTWFFISIDLARSFGKSVAFGVIALWPICLIGLLIIGFDNSTYLGPNAGAVFYQPPTLPPSATA